jgi:ABC-2 type transport system permease protein
MLVYTFVFSFVFRLQPDPGNPSGLDSFALWFLCGFLPWLFFANVVNQGTASLVSNAGLIQKVYFSRVVLPLSTVGSSAYNWIFEMSILTFALLIAGANVLPWLPLTLLAMVFLGLFAAGIAMLTSVANVYFRDTEHILGLVLQVWMFMTPIIYPISLVEQQSEQFGGLLGTQITVMDVYNLNPMVHFVDVFRDLLYNNASPDLSSWIFCSLAGILSVSIGFLVFRRNEKGLAEAL